MANAGTATEHTPNAVPQPAAATTSAGNPGTRSGPRPRVRGWERSRVSERSTAARATTRVPTRVTSAEPNSALAGVPMTRNTATAAGPTMKTSSSRMVSAAIAVACRCSRPVPGAVSVFQAPRTAAVSGGYPPPATAELASTAQNGKCRVAVSTSTTRATGWTTAVISSTGVAPYRSARRPATGEAAAPDSA